MTAKEYLSRYRRLNAYIDCKVEEVAQLRDLATRLTPTKMFDHNGNTTDKVGRTVAKIVDLENEINSQIDELIIIREEIVKTIEQVQDERLRAILMKRYINGDKWEQIAVDMSIDLRFIYRLHGRALQKIKIDH